MSSGFLKTVSFSHLEGGTLSRADFEEEKVHICLKLVNIQKQFFFFKTLEQNECNDNWYSFLSLLFQNMHHPNNI